MISELLYWVWLSLRLMPGSQLTSAIVNKYSGVYEMYSDDSTGYSDINGIDETVITRLSDKNLDEASRIIDYCEKNGVKIITFGDEEYPHNLRMISDPPVLLYVKGDVDIFNKKLSVGMVGTRRMTEYGCRNAYRISFDLARTGIVIVSGMAIGVDGVCASGAISAGGGTVAVLGCGIDRVYPKHHTNLERMIINNGAVVTEFAPGVEPMSYNFPLRNRIISGLSHAVVVVEAGEKSGALITAECAVKQGRTVFAVPWSMDAGKANGVNDLLKAGCRMIVKATDIMQFFEGDPTFRWTDTVKLYGKSANYECTKEIFARFGIYTQKGNSYIPVGNLLSDNWKNEDSFIDNITRIGKSYEREVFNSDEKSDSVSLKKENEEKTKNENITESKEVGASVTEQTETKASIDSEVVIGMLNEDERDVYNSLSDDEPLGIDELSQRVNNPYFLTTVLMALEIKGIAYKDQGNKYLRKK